MEKCTSKEIMEGTGRRWWKVMEVSTLRGPHSCRKMCHTDGKRITLMTTNNNPNIFAPKALRLLIVTVPLH
jgi:hypothetical protein